MKKSDNRGFVLAETLIVTVFLMVIFSMLYSNFYPLIGEFEKREVYDDVDGKYSIYWIKKMIEDSSYSIEVPSDKDTSMKERHFVRFDCTDVDRGALSSEKRETCISLVKSLEVEGCTRFGTNCEIYITKYRIGSEDTSEQTFKTLVKGNTLKKYNDNCFDTENQCKNKFIERCLSEYGSNVDNAECEQIGGKRLFRTGMRDYIEALPDYTTESLNYAKYRVIASFHHKTDNNNYYSYATIEVNK